GLACFAPLRVRLWPGKFREPDLVFMAAAHADRIGEKYWGVPDLVAELISPGNPDLDRDIKKDEYARAGIPEYWLVDLEKQTIEVYLWAAGQYQSGRTLRVGDTLASAQLPGFSLALAELFRDE
ncbi:MAG: Uma2 family endonuclease, partial [Chloroflexi bacterium]|nr:Uma2 family endonuclease [Chloroflexota bacterium]